MNAAAIIIALMLGADSDRSLLNALRAVESGSRANPPDGDGGRSIGPYQIMRGYWQDSGVPGDYRQCRERAYSERVIRAYWRRYCPRGTDEQKARCHNSGSNWRRKYKATNAYWSKVKRQLERSRR